MGPIRLPCDQDWPEGWSDKRDELDDKIFVLLCPEGHEAEIYGFLGYLVGVGCEKCDVKIDYRNGKWLTDKVKYYGTENLKEN